MALPVRATQENIEQTCEYLATKPTGAELKEIRSVLGAKHTDGRKISALKEWGLLEESEGRYKLTETGRRCAKGGSDRTGALQDVIRNVGPYMSIVERAAHRHEDALTSTDVASHWYDHFKSEVGESEDSIKEQAVCFFQVAVGSGLGNVIVGRRGASTRFSFNVEALNTFVGSQPEAPTGEVDADRAPTEQAVSEGQGEAADQPSAPEVAARRLAQGIFVAHGKNKKPLGQLKKILDEFKIPYKVATEEPNLGRPISGKVRDIMESCNCAILIFTADEEFKDKDGNTLWRPSENVVYELGATGYLYDNKIVIMKEDGVSFPSNFSDIGYISFEKDQLGAKTMDILKELIGFGIVKVST